MAITEILKKYFLRFLLLFLSTASFLAHSQSTTPSKSQLQQLRNMPLSQQTKLAEQLGINLEAIKGNLTGKEERETEPELGRSANEQQELDEKNENKRIADDIQNGEKEKLEPYGLDMFQGDMKQLDDLTIKAPIGVAPDYVLSANDELRITFFGKNAGEIVSPIFDDGTLDIEGVGSLNVSGLTITQAAEYIRNTVQDRMIGTDVVVRLSGVRVKRVFIIGELRNPGAKLVSGLASVSEILLNYAKINENASIRTIRHLRQGSLVQEVDFYKLLQGNVGHPLKSVETGDTLVVLQRKTSVYLEGEVKRPAIYEIKEEEKFSDLIKFSGGFSPDAYRVVSIERNQDFTHKTVLSIDIVNKDAMSFSLHDGDKVTVGKVSPKIHNSITLIGNVSQPGNYQLFHTDDLGSFFQRNQYQFLNYTDFQYSLLLREGSNGSSNLEVFQFSISEVLEMQGLSDLLLKPEDRLIVFSRFDERQVMSGMMLDDLAASMKKIKKEQEDFLEKQVAEIDYWEMLSRLHQSHFYYEDAQPYNLESKSVEVKNKKNEVTDLDARFEIITALSYSRKLLLPFVDKYLKTKGDIPRYWNVSGEVRFPGKYPLPSNEPNITKLLKAGGGTTEKAFLEHAEITTALDDNLQAAEHKNVSLKLESKDLASIKLKNGDTLSVFRSPKEEEVRTVTVKGEVKFPGEYRINKGETLGELISRVGGITEFGNPAGAVFTRRSIQEQEQENLQKLVSDMRQGLAAKQLTVSSIDSGVANYKDLNSMIEDLSSVQTLGRLVIDLPKIIQGQSENIVLSDGDTLTIPPHRRTINVFGQVFVPSSHQYESSWSLDDYIKASGGFKDLALEDKVYIVRANGRVIVPGSDFWFSTNDNKPVEPGDSIVVPMNTSPIDNLTLWSTVTQILYQSAIGLAAIGNL